MADILIKRRGHCRRGIRIDIVGKNAVGGGRRQRFSGRRGVRTRLRRNTWAHCDRDGGRRR